MDNGLDGRAALFQAVRGDAIVENESAFFLERLKSSIHALFPVSGLLLLVQLMLRVGKADEEGDDVGGGVRKEG